MKLDYDNNKDKIINVPGEDEKACTHPAGHCFGSDGGSGIPDNLRVEKGRGGEFEMEKKDKLKNKVLFNYKAERCQYCLKYYVQENKPEEGN